MAHNTDCVRGSAPRSPHPFAPAAISPAAGDSGAPRAYTAAGPEGSSSSVSGSNTDTGFRFLTAVHKLRAGALL